MTLFHTSARNSSTSSNSFSQGYWTTAPANLTQILTAVANDEFNFWESSFLEFLLSKGFRYEEHPSFLRSFADAYNYGHKVHSGQHRNNGDAYSTHLKVTVKIALDLFFSMNNNPYERSTDIGVLGFLHDTSEDNLNVTLESISEVFGLATAQRVNGLSKASWTFDGGIYRQVKLSQLQTTL